MISHGLSPAIALVDAIQKLARHGPNSLTLPPGLTRASIIRTLSVFVAQLDTAFEPADTNYDICLQASKAISRTLDEALNAPALPSGDPSATAAAGTDGTPNADSAVDVMDFESLDPSI